MKRQPPVSASFYMDGYRRAQIIREHEFYVSQAKSRLLSQFSNISDEADRAGADWLANHARHFDPERHDPADFEEAAYEAAIDFYELLTTMHNRTRVDVIAGYFYEWEKCLRQWLVDEVSEWHQGQHAYEAAWKAPLTELFTLLEDTGFSVKNQPFFPSLDACRLVTNVHKHGDGPSLDLLISTYQQYVNTPPASWVTPSHRDLKVEDADLEDFSEAIVDFWTALPERGEPSNFPDWFAKAISKDG